EGTWARSNELRRVEVSSVALDKQARNQRTLLAVAPTLLERMLCRPMSQNAGKGLRSRLDVFRGSRRTSVCRRSSRFHNEERRSRCPRLRQYQSNKRGDA